MATAAEIQARIEKLKKALASGARTITYNDGKSVTYRDVDEINAAIATLQQDLAVASGTNIVRSFRFTSDKDL